MTFSQFRLSYYSFLFLLKLAIALVLVLWFQNSLYYADKSGLLNLVVDINSWDKNFDKIMELTKVWAMNAINVAIKLAVIFFISWLTKRLIVLSSWIAYWDNAGHISPIFGRALSAHFRLHPHINFRAINYLYDCSKKEANMIKYHDRNQNIQNILKKYDPNFNEDIRYLPHVVKKDHNIPNSDEK